MSISGMSQRPANGDPLSLLFFPCNSFAGFPQRSLFRARCPFDVVHPEGAPADKASNRHAVSGPPHRIPVRFQGPVIICSGALSGCAFSSSSVRSGNEWRTTYVLRLALPGNAGRAIPPEESAYPPVLLHHFVMEIVVLRPGQLIYLADGFCQPAFRYAVEYGLPQFSIVSLFIQQQ